MANNSALIEANELRFMQAWMHRDSGTIRSLAARDFMLMLGSNPPEILDRPSFVGAIDKDLRCSGFRLGESFTRQHGRAIWYAAGAQLELEAGRIDWSGRFLMTGIWIKPRIGSWKLVEKSLSPTASDERLADSVRALQQWR